MDDRDRYLRAYAEETRFDEQVEGRIARRLRHSIAEESAPTESGVSRRRPWGYFVAGMAAAGLALLWVGSSVSSSIPELPRMFGAVFHVGSTDTEASSIDAAKPVDPRPPVRGTAPRKELAPVAPPVQTTRPTPVHQPRDGASPSDPGRPATRMQRRKREVPRRSASSIAQEVTMLEHVHEALLAGRKDQAAQLLRTYEARFPAPTLKQEYEAMRVLVLCATGRMLQGRAEAKLFIRRNASSPFHARIRKECLDAGS